MNITGQSPYSVSQTVPAYNQKEMEGFNQVAKKASTSTMPLHNLIRSGRFSESGVYQVPAAAQNIQSVDGFEKGINKMLGKTKPEERIQFFLKGSALVAKSNSGEEQVTRAYLKGLSR